LTASVLIPTWRRPRSLARCLDALETQTHRPDEVLLVVRDDDAETHGLLAERTPDALPIRVAAPPGAGVIVALNAGFEAARGDVVAVIDDDTAPAPDWLARIVECFAADPGLGGLGGRDRVIGPDGVTEEPRDVVVGRVLPFGRVVGNHHLGRGEIRDADILKGANMALRRAALADIRIDPELRGRGAQPHWEIDLSLALAAAGWRLAYDPRIELDHFPEARRDNEREESMSARERFEAVHNQTYALLKHLGPGRRAVAIAYALLVGSNADPGPALALLAVLRGRPAGEVLGRMRVATAGRIAAFRSWSRWRRSRR
jgi:glycosyltransferase involved in cell wall biosynthesis